MKSKLASLLLLTLFIAVACDQPRDRRRGYSATDESSVPTAPNNPVTGGNSNNSNDDDSSNFRDDSELNGQETDIPAGAGHCQWSQDGDSGFSFHHPHLGAYNICQSEGSDATTYFQIKNPISESSVCFIPAHESGGTPTFVGEPRCLELRDNKKVYSVGMRKNRTGYSNLTIDGLMIMKDKVYMFPRPFNQYLLAPDAYIHCAQWLSQYGDASYCQAFDSVGEYVYHGF